MELNDYNNLNPVQHLIVDYLWELHEVQRNLEIREIIEKEKDTGKTEDFFIKKHLNSCFLYRMSYDFGLFQHALSEIEKDDQILDEVKDEILEIYSNTLFKDIKKSFNENNIVSEEFPLRKGICYLPDDNISSSSEVKNTEYKKTINFFNYYLDLALKLDKMEYVIPIKSLIHKYTSGDSTDYTLFNSRISIYDIDNAESYYISKYSKENWLSKQIQYGFQNLRFPARYLKENSPERDFLSQYYRNYTVIPESVKEKLLNILRHVMNIDIECNELSEKGLSEEYRTYLIYSLSIGIEKWFQKKSIEEKLQILDGNYPIRISDEVLTARFRNSDDTSVYNEGMVLLKNHLFFEAIYPFRYLNLHSKGPIMKHVAGLWLDSIDQLFDYNEERAIKMINCGTYIYSIGYHSVINEITSYRQNLTYENFIFYGDLQKNIFQFESAKKVHEVHSSERLNSKTELALTEYFLGNSDKALNLFSEAVEKSRNSNNFSPFFLISSILKCSIQYEKDLKVDGYNCIIDIINYLHENGQVNEHNTKKLFNMTVRWLQKSCDLSEIVILCDNLGDKLESYGADKFLVNYLIGYAFGDHSCLDEAIIFYNRAIPETEDIIQKGNVKARMADIYSKKGDFVNAEKYYNELLLIEPNNAEIYYLRALNHAAMNEYSYAASIMKRAVNLNKKKEMYKDLLKLYQKLSEKEGIYLWRIEDPDVKAQFEHVNYKLKRDSPDEKTFSDVTSLCGAGLEQYLKVNIAFPLRDHINAYINEIGKDFLKKDLESIESNDKLNWINKLLNKSEMELGNWGFINRDIMKNKGNKIILEIAKYLNHAFDTKDKNNPVPVDLIKNIKTIREHRNTSSHGNNYTREMFEKERQNIILNLNNVIMMIN